MIHNGIIITKKYLAFWILLLPMVLFGQQDAAQLFEPALIKADIDTLISKLIDVHPSFLEHYKTNSIESKVEQIKSQINKPISSLDFLRLMQPIIAIDGHTTLRHTGGLCPGEKNYLFPFKVIIYDNALYIKENLTDNPSLVQGSIIESINGISSQAIIENLIRYIPGEKKSFKTKNLEGQFHVFMALVYGSLADFKITVNGTDVSLKGTTWSDFEAPSKPKFEMRIYDNDIAYIYKRKFMPPRDFMYFMDSVFTEIADKEINYLIIGNLRGGGLTDLADSLMSYFTDKPYGLMEKQVTKMSPLTKEFIEENKGSGFMQDGYYIKEYTIHYSTKPNPYTGPTYIITGPLSYSAATCFPAAAKHYGDAIIVGEESGQPLLSNGGQSSFTLPNTNTTCITSLSTIYMPGHNNDRIHGVRPDYEVRPTLSDLLNDTEYLLEYTLRLIKADKLRKHQ